MEKTSIPRSGHESAEAATSLWSIGLDRYTDIFWKNPHVVLTLAVVGEDGLDVPIIIYRRRQRLLRQRVRDRENQGKKKPTCCLHHNQCFVLSAKIIDAQSLLLNQLVDP